MRKIIVLLLLIYSSINLYGKWTLEKMEEACSNGNLQECVNVGLFLQNDGKYEEAIERFIDGCHNELSSGCNNLGRTYKLGIGVKKDIKKHLYYYQKGCEYGSKNSCYMLGSYYEKGEFYAKNYKKAYDFYLMACNLGTIDACHAIGWFFENGKGVKKNKEKSKTYYKKVCDANDHRGCYPLGSIYFEEEKLNKAFNVFEKACNLGHYNSCQNVAWMYKKGKGVKVNFLKSAEYYKIACNKNIANSCVGLAGLYSNGRGVKKDLTMSFKFFQKACNLGHKNSCYYAIEVRKLYD